MDRIDLPFFSIGVLFLFDFFSHMISLCSSICKINTACSFFASEMIRATLFEKLGKELPYCCEVRMTQFKEPVPGEKNPTTRMQASILVERDSQKGIVVGKGGQMIKDVGVTARKMLEDFFQTKVHLDLQVKVDKGWRGNEKKLKEYGYMK